MLEALTISSVPLALTHKLRASEPLLIIRVALEPLAEPLRFKETVTLPLAVKSESVTARTGRIAKNKANTIITRNFFMFLIELTSGDYPGRLYLIANQDQDLDGLSIAAVVEALNKLISM